MGLDNQDLEEFAGLNASKQYERLIELDNSPRSSLHFAFLYHRPTLSRRGKGRLVLWQVYILSLPHSLLLTLPLSLVNPQVDAFNPVTDALCMLHDSTAPLVCPYRDPRYK